jgi:hypothetical protein
MFFRHELPKRINFWSGFIIVSPYFGPFMANFVVWKLSWRWVYWVWDWSPSRRGRRLLIGIVQIYAIMNYVAFALLCVLVDETFYDRSLPRDRQPPWRSRILRLTGVERHGRQSFIEAVTRPFIAATKLPVAIVTVYYFLNFAW